MSLPAYDTAHNGYPAEHMNGTHGAVITPQPSLYTLWKRERQTPRPTPPARCTLKWCEDGIEYLYTVEGDGNADVFRMLKEVKAAIATGRVAKAQQASEPPHPMMPPDDVCLIHHAPMRQRTGKYGVWWQHELPDGTVCKGKPQGRKA